MDSECHAMRWSGYQIASYPFSSLRRAVRSAPSMGGMIVPAAPTSMAIAGPNDSRMARLARGWHHPCAMRIGVTAFLTDRSMRPDDLARGVETRGFDSLFVPGHTHI